MLVTVQKCVKNIFFYLNEEARQSRRRTGSRRTFLFYLFLTLSFVPHFQVLAAPTSLTYQGRILKADGTPLEYNNVGFIFQITNPSGACILYQEQVSGYDMTNSGGVFDVPIGEGTISYPLGGGFTVTDTFNNSSTFTCGSCSGYTCANGSGTYSPAVNDGRRLRVQFYDGSGWRTISPDNVIRSVPFAAYSMSAQKLGNKVVEDFMLKAGLPTCGAGTFLTWNGTTMSCASVAGASGGTVTDVTSTNSYLSVANGTSTPTLTLNVGTSAGTVAAGNDSRITGALQSGAAAGGSLSGTYPNPGIANNAVTSATINDGAITTTKALTTNPGINRIVGTDGTTGASLSKMECSTVGHVLSWTVATGFQCNAISSLYTAPVTTVAGKTGAVSLVSADIGDATDANTVNMLVKRDASGNFSAGTISSTGLVAGTLQVTGGTPASGKVLTSDATGNATWQALTASQWSTSGSDIYYNSGKVGIGTTSPTGVFDVEGGTSVSGNGLPIKLIAQNGLFSGNTNGGGINLTAGNAFGTGTGGDIQINAGSGNGAAGGSIKIGASNFSSGDITIQTGQADTNGVTGAHNLLGGMGGWNTSGGVVNIVGGLGGNNGRDGGPVNITGGTATGSAANGANVEVNGGAKAGTGVDGNVLLASSRGKVGIGTVSPGALLDVNGTMRVNQICDSTGANCKTVSGGWNATLGFSSLSAATSIGTIDNTNFAQTWNWSSATTENPMTITADSLTTGSLMNLTSSSASLNSTNGLLNVANTSAATNGVVARIQSNSTAGSGLTVHANGNVGIGITTPHSTLDILSGNSATAGVGNLGLRVFNGSTTAGQGAGIGFAVTNFTAGPDNVGAKIVHIRTGAHSQGDLAFYTSPLGTGLDSTVERLRIKDNGYVGIGTTAPAAVLDILGTSAGTGSASASKVLNIVGGAGGTTGGNGGGVSITGGNATVYTGGVGGSLSFTAGNGSNGGNVTFTSGTAINAGTGSSLALNGGGSGGDAGTVTITSGNGGNGAAPGGTINITAGNGAGGGVAQNGGPINITAGGGATGGSGASVTINGGAKNGAGSDGNVVLANLRGNVGIGTTSPVSTAKLTVNGSIDTNANPVIIGNTSGNSRASDAVDIQATRSAVTKVASGASSVAIGTNNSADAAATTAIGTSNVASTAGFWGSTAIGNSNTAKGSGSTAIGSNNAINSTWDVATAVGYGNNVSNHYGTAFGYNNNISGSSGIGIGISNIVSANGSIAIGANITNSVASSLQIGPSDTSKITILSSGNVGIGTTTPAATLDINGTAKLKKYAAEPNACDATHDGQLALTSVYTTCVCNGTSWVKTSDGSSVCIWF